MALANGAVLANNLAVMLFFWESILVTMYLMIMSAGGEKSSRTSAKALVIVGVTDLCMMLGIGMASHLAGTLEMDGIRLPLSSWGIFAFLFMLIGALGKAGAMPFHTWIPDAADDAPMPFMAFLPAALEKLLGIYLLVRICVDLFEFKPGSAMSIVLMIIGAFSILFAVMMALIQKDFKRLLSYHAVSQVGYMILGIGTALPIGIVGGLFHMLNNAVYKCGLFLAAGSVERQAGTTDLRKISGLGRKMPITFACFIIAAASIAGFPLTNGFFSKEMIFDSALESGVIFYIIAVAGAFFTAISFLKLGHAAFMGKPNDGRPNVNTPYDGKSSDGKPNVDSDKVKEAPWPMLVPMIVLSLGCIVLGLGKSWVIGNLLQPVINLTEETGESLGGGTNWVLVGISVIVLALAVLDHLYGAKKSGSGLKATDHFHYAPVLHNIYEMAEKKYFDPYHAGKYAARSFSALALKLNDGINWIYDSLIVRVVGLLSSVIRKTHTGTQVLYLGWALAGIVIVAAIFIVSL
jgi:NADH-quinone oxidoreductase subunit L